MLSWLRRRRTAPQAAETADRHRRSMAARPVQAPRLRAAERDGGGLLVTVRLQRSRWQQFLGGGRTSERTFGLDAVGRQVYEWCDGRATVADLVDRFARDKQVHVAEAETAVTMFLRTLVDKGLVLIEIDRPKSKAAPKGKPISAS